MNKFYTFLAVLSLSSTIAVAQNTVDCSASDTWTGYMNVFDLPADGGGYQFGSAWGLDDMKSTFDLTANTVTLQPNFNTYADNPTDPFWVNQTTTEGNKNMEGSTFVEPAGLNDADLTFKGHVISNTIDAGYETKFFIKALDPNAGYSDALGGAKVFDLPASGYFEVSATAAELPAGLIIQYGFSITGPNANPANEATVGSVVIGSGLLSVNETPEELQLSVYPNPATDILTISGEKTVENFKIMNLTGQVVLQGTNSNSIDVSTLESGVYVIQLDDSNRRKTMRFIKQ